MRIALWQNLDTICYCQDYGACHPARPSAQKHARKIGSPQPTAKYLQTKMFREIVGMIQQAGQKCHGFARAKGTVFCYSLWAEMVVEQSSALPPLVAIVLEGKGEVPPHPNACISF